MRIAYLVNQYPKVSHSFIRREILALESQGVEVVRIALRGWDADVVDPEDLRERSRTRYALKRGAWPLLAALVRRALTAPVRFTRALRVALKMSRGSDRSLIFHLIYLAEACLIGDWLHKENVAHIHAHFGTNPAEIASLIRAGGGPSFSFTVHGPEEFDKPTGLHLREKIRLASHVIAVSSFGSSQLRRWAITRDWPKIQVVHCGIDQHFIGNDPETSPAGNKFVCVGRLCEQKGQLLLIDAAAELRRRGHDFRLVLAGDGEMRDAIEGHISALALNDVVTITGWITGDQVRDEILSSRALVLPSFAEGLPVVIMEAMALRRPVISTFVAGIPELVQNGRTGWLVPAGDTQQLAEALETALRAPDDVLKQMGILGRARVIERHSAATEAKKLVSLFATTSPAH